VAHVFFALAAHNAAVCVSTPRFPLIQRYPPHPCATPNPLPNSYFWYALPKSLYKDNQRHAGR
jgi:hypothetical protein